MTPRLRRWSVFLVMQAGLACNGGFKEQDGGAGDGKIDRETAPTSCSNLEVAAGPIMLGLGEAESYFSAIAASSTHVASVWEQYRQSGAHEGSLQLAVTDPAGKSLFKGQLDESDYPAVPAIAAIKDKFGVVHVRKGGTQELQYLLVDTDGKVQHKRVLATGIGQYAAESTIAAGSAGIAVGYTSYLNDTESQVYLGAIKETGEPKPKLDRFAVTATNPRHLRLAPRADGFVGAWTESVAGDRWRVLVGWLDASTQLVGTPVVVAEEKVHRRPAVAGVGDDLFVCYETRDAPKQDASIECRLVSRNGTLGSPTVTTLPGLSSRQPEVVPFLGGFAVLWTGVTAGLEQVHARLFSASGTAGGKAHRVSESGVRSWSPAVVRVGDELMAAWYRYVPITVHYAAFRLGCDV